jgi:hypothetical protein
MNHSPNNCLHRTVKMLRILPSDEGQRYTACQLLPDRSGSGKSSRLTHALARDVTDGRTV